METPPQSPDTNPIENLWELMDRKIREKQNGNKNDLIQALEEEWENITLEVT